MFGFCGSRHNGSTRGRHHLRFMSREAEMRRTTYPIELRSLYEDGSGGWVATVPEIPQCVAMGSTPQEAVRNIETRLDEWTGSPVFQYGRDQPLKR